MVDADEVFRPCLGGPVSTTTGEMDDALDVVDVLLADHAVLRDLLARLDASDRPSEMRRLYLRIVDEFCTHEAAEEEVLFPIVRALIESDAGAVVASIGEHGEVDDLLTEMRCLPPTGCAFAKRATALVVTLGAHLDAEEEQLFPLLREALGPDRLQDLAEAVVTSKERAPAFHEHPLAGAGT
jgi:hemerythrin superfamily protein